MANLFKEHEVDSRIAKEGAAVKIDGCTFTVRRASVSNRAFHRALAQHAAKFREIFSADLSDPAARDAALDHENSVMQEAFFGTVVTGWQDVDSRDGQPLPFTRENWLDLVRSCPDVWVALRNAASDNDNFRRVQEDGEQLGKS